MKQRRQKKNREGHIAVDGKFEEAFEQNYDAIFKYLRRRVGEDRAADLTAETFLVALAQMESFDPERGNLRSWLFGISANLMRREVRSERRELRAFARTGVDPVLADPTAAIDQRLDAQSQQRALVNGLMSLKDKDRESLLLLCWADLNYPEIAEALDIPIGTVKSRIARARKKLRKSLGGGESLTSRMFGEEASNG